MAGRVHPVIKGLIVLAVLAGLGLLFVRSARETRAEPYTVDRAQLQGWIIAIDSPSMPTAPMLSLRASPVMASALFRQLFTRLAESLSAPAVPVVPLVLQDEFARAFAGRVTVEALADHARQAGLEASPLEPRCLVSRRESAPGVTRQVHVVLFDAPAFTRFRERIAALTGGGPALFDPHALSPILVVAASDPSFQRWLPLQLDPERDCVAGIEMSGGA